MLLCCYTRYCFSRSASGNFILTLLDTCTTNNRTANLCTIHSEIMKTERRISFPFANTWRNGPFKLISMKSQIIFETKAC
mmetsp:Transcript_1181/g.1728  ORF Transcript_1181/g.1728 Transcript_1181/m.1728 type:complete len:80 (+) Transcript_1181:70-309(+)